MSEIKPFTGVDDRVRLADSVPVDTPFTLNVFPSEVCNFRCCYCAQSLGKEKLREEYGLQGQMMSIETMELAVRQSKEFPHRYKLVSFMGHGEPLCNKRLPDMIYCVKNGGIADRIDIITNASLLTPEFSDRLLEAGLDVLRVSLQGINSESYRNTCGVNIDFQRFYENLAYFYKASRATGCKLYVKTMDVSLKDGETDRFYELFGGISDRMYIDKVKPVYDKVSYTEEQNDISVDRYGNRHERRIVCPQPFYMLSLWPDGDVAPCDALYKANPLGNIYDTSLAKMWLNKNHKDFCVCHLSGGRFFHEKCSRCCAPDDVAHKEDILDGDREKLLQIFKTK